MWPYSFRLTMWVELKDDSLDTTLRVENMSNCSMVSSMCVTCSGCEGRRRPGFGFRAHTRSRLQHRLVRVT